MMKLINRTLVLGLLSAFSLVALAHDRYILPTYTVLSGEGEKPVTLVASISNEVFHPQMPLGDDGKGKVSANLKALFEHQQSMVLAPNGETSAITWRAYALQSIADVTLKTSGTHRVSMVQPDTLMTTFRTPDGSGGRRFGDNPSLPEDATDVVKRTIASRVDTYLTLNGTTRETLKPTGVGIELTGKSHPNDLFVGEKAQFTLVFNGKPVTESMEITLIREDTRHRNQREAIEVTTNDKGEFELTFDEPGFYLMHTGLTLDGKTGSDIVKHHHSLFVTLEVFPQ